MIGCSKLFRIFILLIFFSPILLFAQTITSTGSLSYPRWFHQSEELVNGNIIVFGGDNGNYLPGANYIYNSAEIYNTSTGAWSQTGSMKERRTNFGSVVLNNGKVLAIGGHPSIVFDGEKRSCEIYDPQMGLWSYIDSMKFARFLHSVIKLKDGRILVAGGIPNTTSAEIYNPDTETWSVTGSLNYGIGDGSSTVMLADGRILTTNGRNGEIYDPSTEVWSALSSQLNGDRQSHSSVLLNDGRVLISGSIVPADQFTAEIFDPLTNTFTSVGNMMENRGNSPAILMDNGKVLAFGVGDIFNPFNSKLIEVYDPSTGLWSSNTYNVLGTQAYTINKLINGKILIAGGSYSTGNGASTGCFLINQNLGTCSPLNLNLTVVGEPMCKNTNGTVSILSSEIGVLYQAYLNNTAVSGQVSGGGDINLNINAGFLRAGENIITVKALKNSCPLLGLKDTASLLIYQPVITYSSGSLQICQGDSIKLNAPGGYASYLWSNGSTNEIINVKAPGTFFVQVSNGTCWSPASLTKEIVVNPIVNTSISISITNGSNPSVSGSPVTFKAFPVNGGHNAHFTWNVNGSPQGTNANVFTSSTLTDNDVVSCIMTPDTTCPNNISPASNNIIISLSNSPGIISQNPIANSFTISGNSSISATFSRTMSVASAQDSVIKVFGNATGKLQGTFNSSNSAVISFNPNRAFYPGEQIQVSIASKAKDIAGDTLSKSYVYNFKAASGNSTGTFFTQKSPQPCASDPYNIATADFDHDGDMDIVTSSAGSATVTVGKNNGSGLFTLSTLQMGTGSIDVIAADFNNDGYADIAVVTWQIVVALNDGTGNFPILKSSVFTGSPSVWKYCSGDFDGNGTLDIALADKSAGFIIYKNDGTASFQKQPTVPSSLIDGINSGDVDNDGDLDILTVNASSASIFLNDGTGNYTLYNTYSIGSGTGSQPRGGELADIDKDGDLDLITSNFENTNTVSIRKNNGSGIFGSLTNLQMGALAGYLCVADFDGDGDPDIATGNNGVGTSNISVTYNDGLGNFSHSVNYANNTSPGVRGICSADFDGDGDLDLAVVNANLNSFNLRINQAPIISSSFVADSYYCAGSNFTVPFTTSGSFLPGNNFQIQLSDSSGGFANPIIIATVSTGSPLNPVIPQGTIPGKSYKIRITSTFPNVLVGAVSNSFEIAICPSVVSNYPISNQINIPNDTDVVVTFSQPMNLASFTNSSFRVSGSLQGNIPGTFSYGSASNIMHFSPSKPFKTGETISVSLTTGIKNALNHIMLTPYVLSFLTDASPAPGTLVLASHIKEGNWYPRNFTVGYFTQDNNPDLFSVYVGTANVVKGTFYKNQNKGAFLPSISLDTVSALSSQAADFDNDNDLDLAYVSQYKLKILKNNAGNSSFTGTAQTFYYGDIDNFKPVDVDGDGDMDIVTAHASSNLMQVLKNDGTGYFSLFSSMTVIGAPYGIDAKDLDNDGDIDVVTGNTNSSNICVLLNDGKGIYSILNYYAALNGPRIIECVDIDNDRDADIVVGNIGNANLCIYKNNGNAVFTQYNYLTGGVTVDFDMGDLDGDGDVDIAQGISGANGIAIHRNDGNGNFTFLYSLSQYIAVGLNITDVDQDGDNDLISTGGYSTYPSVFINGNFIKTAPINKRICLPQTFSVPFVCQAPLNSGNIFTAQLSDKFGNFSSPQVIGTLNSSVASGSVPVVLPSSITSGNSYRIRVVSSNPVLTSYDNDDSLFIASQQPVLNDSISGPSDVCLSVATSTYTLPYQNDLVYKWSSVDSYIYNTYENKLSVNWTLNPDTVNIACSVSNGCGSLGVISKTVRVHTFITSATPAIIGLSNVCNHQRSISYSIPSVTDASNYTWTVPSDASITSSNRNNIVVNFGVNSGNISVSVSNVCAPSNYPSNKVISVGTTIKPSIHIVNDSIYTNVTGVTYHWKKNGDSIGTNLPYVKKSGDGSYKVITTDLINGCLDSSDIIQINANAVVVTDVTPGKNSTNSIYLYPNPTRSMSYMTSAETMKDITMSIETMQGSVIKQYFIKELSPDDNYKMDVSSLSKGVYIIRITSGADYLFNKLIIE